MSVQWEDPPRPARGVHSVVFSPEVLAALRARPGVWAKIAEGKSASIAVRARKSHPDLEIRATGPNAAATIYARAKAEEDDPVVSIEDLMEESP